MLVFLGFFESSSDFCWSFCSFVAPSKWFKFLRYCYDDYSLSESAASYYSPYKLKQSMVGRPEMSTSCSFGMMAHLDRVGLTDSPCAGILVGEKGTKAKNVSGHLATNCGEEIHPRWFEKTAFEYITLRLQDNYVNQSYKKLKWKFLNIHSGEATFWFAWPLDFYSRLHELDLKLWPAMPQQPRCWSSRSRKIGALEFGMRLWRRVRPVQLHDFLLGQSMVSRLRWNFKHIFMFHF